MASSFRSILEGFADSGQNVELQKYLKNLFKTGEINKQQGSELFSELVPIASKNQKPPEPLSASELANVRSKIENQDGGVRGDFVTRALRNGQITRAEANSLVGKKSAPASRSGSSTPASRSESSAPFGSTQTRESFTELLEKLKKSKADLASRLGKTNTPASEETAPAPSPAAEPASRETATEPSPAEETAPRVTGPAFKSVNTPVSNPDAPTNNVTKPTGAATGPAPKNKKDARGNSDFDAIDNLDLTEEQKNDLKFSKAQERFGPSFNKGDFSFLLNKLEGSKIRQNRDAQSQERKNIYSRGLSSMFANF